MRAYFRRLTNSQTLEITTEPSPTEEATRLTDPDRTSPTAKSPGRDVAKGESTPAAAPVRTKPFSSRSTSPEQSTGGNDALPRLAYVPDGHGIELFPAVQRRDFCAVFDRDARVRREAAGEIIRH